MLVLSRKKNEQIMIGGSIVITIVGIERGVVKLGIEAPKDVTVNRKEVSAKDNEVEANNLEIKNTD